MGPDIFQTDIKKVEHDSKLGINWTIELKRKQMDV